MSTKKTINDLVNESYVRELDLLKKQKKVNEWKFKPIADYRSFTFLSHPQTTNDSYAINYNKKLIGFQYMIMRESLLKHGPYNKKSNGNIWSIEVAFRLFDDIIRLYCHIPKRLIKIRFYTTPF